MKKQLTILITAGPTIEPIDPVRYISNHSTGKMGYALAKVCLQARHRVILISGPTLLKPPRGCEFIAIKSAQEMHDAVLNYFPQCDLIFKVAAVADFRIKHIAKKKIKKSEASLTLELIKNKDILKKLGTLKKPHQILVGFAAETHQGVHYARSKLKEKNLDWIVLNEISKKNVGFGSDFNEVTLISSDGKKISFPQQNKIKVAELILKTVLRIPIDQKRRFDFRKFKLISWLMETGGHRGPPLRRKSNIPS